MKKDYLALFRAGGKSLHPYAVRGIDALPFDYALSWFGDAPPEATGASFVHWQKGPKWPGLESTIRAHWDEISQYRYVWLPDDDLLCDPEVVARMFQVCSDLKLDLAQPALTKDSYFSHPITLQHDPFQVRFTNFVEIMAPVLSADMLSKVFPTFTGNASGYGLDSLWPRFSEMGRLAIIDDTPIKHTRPVGGPNHALVKDGGRTPVQEDWIVSARHFIDAPFDVHLNFGGLLQNGDTICLGGTREEAELMLQALQSALAGLAVTSMQSTRYLANHLYYWSGETAGGQRYPRALVPALLSQALEGTGITFHRATQPAAPMLFPHYNN
jgi:hypothetical protein